MPLDCISRRNDSARTLLTEPAHSLISQSIHAVEATRSINGDGFGLGWYGTHPEPGLYREIRPAWSDENLRYLCRHLQSHLFFAHVRAATGTPVTRPNCHPFACGRWLFMHNGFVGNWSGLRRQVEALIPDKLYPARIGTTDLEAIFLAIVGAGIEDPVAATQRTLGRLTDLVNQNGRKTASASPPRFRMDRTCTLSAMRSTIRPTRFTTGSRKPALWSFPNRSMRSIAHGSPSRSAMCWWQKRTNERALCL